MGCCVVLTIGGEGRCPCLAERLGSNFVSNFGSYFVPWKSLLPGKERGGKWGDNNEELNAEVNIGGGGIKLAENPAVDETENGNDGIDVGDIHGEAISNKIKIKYFWLIQNLVKI